MSKLQILLMDNKGNELIPINDIKSVSGLSDDIQNIVDRLNEIPISTILLENEITESLTFLVSDGTNIKSISMSDLITLVQ